MAKFFFLTWLRKKCHNTISNHPKKQVYSKAVWCNDVHLDKNHLTSRNENIYSGWNLWGKKTNEKRYRWLFIPKITVLIIRILWDRMNESAKIVFQRKKGMLQYHKRYELPYTFRFGRRHQMDPDLDVTEQNVYINASNISHVLCLHHWNPLVRLTRCSKGKAAHSRLHKVSLKMTVKNPWTFTFLWTHLGVWLCFNVKWKWC